MKKLYLATAAILLAVPAAFATADVEPVVVVKTENGPVRISASQYDPKQHELHVADEHHDANGVQLHHRSAAPAIEAPSAPIGDAGNAGQTAQPIAPAVAAPARQFGVMQDGKKFFIVDGSNGQRVTDIAAFDPKGYASNKEAWDMITAAAMASAAPASDNGGQAA